MLSHVSSLVTSFLLVLQSSFASAQRVCNNSPLLCDRNYNNITHLGAHDSPFVRNASNAYTIAGDQWYPPTTQLAAGVRLLTGQIHAFNTSSGHVEWRLCHTSCLLYDAGTLSGFLTDIKKWLDKNPNDVVTILLVNSDNATAGQLGPQFEKSGIVKYTYTPSDTTQPVTSWPTLNELIDMDQRLIVFIASLDPTTNTAAPYLLDEFTFLFENNYDNDSPQDFSCTANRPDQFDNQTDAALASGRLPLMNHFLYLNIGGIEVPAVLRASHTNAPNGTIGNLGDSADECTAVYGSSPPYIIVDFFNEGPAIETVDRLNGVVGNVSGRKKVSKHGFPLSSQSTNPLSSGSSLSGTSSTSTPTTGSSAGAGRNLLLPRMPWMLASSALFLFLAIF